MGARKLREKLVYMDSTSSKYTSDFENKIYDDDDKNHTAQLISRLGKKAKLKALIHFVESKLHFVC